MSGFKSIVNNIHEETKEGYIPGVHCGDKNCYSCGTQRYRCAWLEELDKLDAQKDADLEAQDYDTFGDKKI
tara:strand:+ start:695 stop:907 length:213 start_codon:yes stop_codon:yes gene_type:complete